MLILFLKPFKYIFLYFISLNSECASELRSAASVLGIFRALLMSGWTCHINAIHHSPLCLPFNNRLAIGLVPPQYHIFPQIQGPTRHRLSNDRLSMFVQTPDTLKSNAAQTTLRRRSSGSSSIIPVQTLIGLAMPTSPPPNSWCGTPTRQWSIRMCHIDSDTKTPLRL